MGGGGDSVPKVALPPSEPLQEDGQQCLPCSLFSWMCGKGGGGGGGDKPLNDGLHKVQSLPHNGHVEVSAALRAQLCGQGASDAKRRMVGRGGGEDGSGRGPRDKVVIRTKSRKDGWRNGLGRRLEQKRVTV